MSKVYKIHPAVGIARLGNHETAFFIGPEKPGAAGVEIAADGSESPVTRYKDGGKIKRQAARFRVYEYETDGSGGLKLVGEVKGDQVKIEWRVNLVNRKAALDHSPDPGHPAKPRNVRAPYGSVARNKLIIRDKQPQVAAGKNQPGVKFVGQFLDKDVYLGELRTDPVGRLLVLGGRGNSEGIPLNPGAPIPPLDEFANNDGWHDDVADGPVTATLTFRGQTPIQVHQPAWVVVAPPDYAPGIGGLVTLYEVATQAAIEGGMLKADPKPSFRRHIKPVIERAAGLRWVHNWSRWNSLLPLDWNALSDPGAGSADLRKTVGNRIKSPGLRNYVMPDFLRLYFDQWIAGNFLSDRNDPDTPPPEPAALDLAALDACIGANFFPGIEASITLRDKDIYGEPYRLNHAVTAKVYPGCLSEIMALPWQADFIECDSGQWWPSQRPDIAMLNKNNVPGSQKPWAAPLGGTDHQGMVDHWKQLGFILADQAGGQTVFVEVDRDSGFPR
jgi:hypothetical protein